MRCPIGDVDQSGKAQQDWNEKYEAVEAPAKRTIYAAKCAQGSDANEHTSCEKIRVRDVKDIIRVYANPTIEKIRAEDECRNGQQPRHNGENNRDGFANGAVHF